jgi:hypothetical protein
MKLKFLCVLLLAVFLLVGCSGDKDDKAPISLDISNGRASSVFDNVRANAKTVEIEVIRQGETMAFLFEGVYLSEIADLSSFTMIEAVTEDMGVVDITIYGTKTFLAWSESGNAESPMRVFPDDAATGNLLIRNVTEIIITR